MNKEKEALYQSKFITVQQALDMVQDGDIVYHGFYGNEPRNLLRQFHTIADRVNHVDIWCTNPDEEYQFITDDSIGNRIEVYSVFYGPLRGESTVPDGFIMFPIISMQQCR